MIVIDTATCAVDGPCHDEPDRHRCMAHSICPHHCGEAGYFYEIPPGEISKIGDVDIEDFAKKVPCACGGKRSDTEVKR